jgi:hypothetical protein
MQQGSAVRDGDGGNGPRHVLGTQRGAFERIDSDIDPRPLSGSDSLADVKHRRLVPLAFSDDDGSVNRQPVELSAHRINSHLVCPDLIAAPAHACRAYGRTLGYPDDFDAQDTLEQQSRVYVN